LTLADEIDVSRGDLLTKSQDLPHLDDRFDAQLVWMSEDPLVPGKQYLLKHGAKVVYGHVSRLCHRVDVNTLAEHPATSLALNEIARCEITLAEPVAFDAYADNRETGAFILIDRIENTTVGAGMIHAPTGQLDRDHWDEAPHGRLYASSSKVSTGERERRLGQRPVTILLTGLSKSGKSAVASAVERRLFDMGKLATLLDGQNFRLGMSRDLGFTAIDRSENMRRAAEVAKLMNDAGLICLTAFVVPHRQVRRRARETVGAGRFLEVHLTAPLTVLRARDRDGLYAAAERGELPSFPGVTSDFEPPDAPDLVLETDRLDADECAQRIIELLEERQFIQRSQT
jgi:bifunctional enzyme CysN/CysC